MQIMQDFNNLTARPDVNPGNTLIDGTSRVWFIDSTRAFGNDDDLICPAAITSCERALIQRLQALDSGLVREELGPYLSKAEINVLLKRRRKSWALCSI